MKLLRFPLHRRGHCGWSNALMSLECGVLLAYMTGRALAVDGNISPPANLRSDAGVARLMAGGERPRKASVTDLYEIPVRWFEVAKDELLDDGSTSFRTLSKMPLYSCVYYFSDEISTDHPDFRAFAHKRLPENFVHCGSNLDRFEVVSIDTESALSFYSYLVYLTDKERRRAHEALSRMRPKLPYRDLARSIVERIGVFNAVHVRLGDFRATTGVTTCMRTPQEVVGHLDRHFSRDQTLVICTDESDNEEFFDVVRSAYPKTVMLDTFVFEDPDLGGAFFDLPFHDDMAMAVLTQLVASHSDNFIGSMTSTFTAIIQRMRGNRGKAEDFKYLWCEIPDPGVAVERGRHAVAKTIPFEDNRFIEELEGPYSWNRIDLWVGCEYYGWFREWPESFLTS